MHTYTTPRKSDSELQYAGTREWVFPLLGTRKTRDRVNLIAALELKRRPDCEPTLRSLVTDEWSPETLHHIGWCDSCRIAGFALDAGAFAGGRAAGASNRGRAALVGLILAAAIAVPAIASQFVDNPFDSSPIAARGGIASVVHKRVVVPRSHKPPSTTGTPGAKGTSGNAGSERNHGGKAVATGTAGSAGSGRDHGGKAGSNGTSRNAGSGRDHGGKAGATVTTTTKPPAKVIPKPRSKPLGNVIPSHHATMIVPKPRLPLELPHTT